MASVILYELNEVPWEIIDLYVERRPRSHTARLLERSRCQTTRNDDPSHLSPWSTWPTFHTGTFSSGHNSYALGQDPDTFVGPNMWEVVERDGGTVGLFGVLQSWPPREFAHGGFYVPDTFAKTPATVPSSLESFQQFNLSMTTELGFSADGRLGPTRMIKAGLAMVRQGLTPWSAVRLARQLLRERRDARYKAGRSIMQAVPAFDLFWRLHRRTKPALSIFFTNHVAGMLHRFWGDTFPDYSATYGYAADDVFGEFVVEAMDVFDHQLGKIVREVDRDPGATLVVAASMGQSAVPYNHIGETYVVDDAQKLASALSLGPAEVGLAMYPLYALEFPSEEAAAHASEMLSSVTSNGEQLVDAQVFGRSVSYSVQMQFDGDDLPRDVEYVTEVGGPAHRGTIDDLGIDTAKRLGGGNTAYHVPEGIYITYGAGVEPDDSRAVFDVRDAASDVLGHLGLQQAWAEARVAQ